MSKVNILSVGEKIFDGKDWRRAILHYLFLMWKGADATTLPLKIENVNIIAVNIPCVEVRYFAYLSSPNLSPIPKNYVICNSPTKISVCGDEYDFPEALVRFVKNDKIKGLDLLLGMSAVLLNKGTKRGELFLSGNLSSTTLAEATKGYLSGRQIE